MDEITKKTEGFINGGQSHIRNIRVTNTQQTGRVGHGSGTATIARQSTEHVRTAVNMVQNKVIRESITPVPHRVKNNDTDRSGRSTNFLDRVVTICMFMLFFGLPLFFMNLTYQGVNFEKQYYFYLWSFCGIVAMISRGMLGGKIEFRRTSLDIALAGLWIITLISTIFSVDKYHSVFGFFDNPVSGLVSATALILTYYLVVSHVTKERVMLMWWAIVASGSIVTIWTFLVTMRFVPQNILDHTTASLTGSFTSLGIFLGMMLPMFIVSFSVISGDIYSSVRAKAVAFLLVVFIALDIFTLSVLHGYVRWFMILAAVAALLIFMISRSVKVSQNITMSTVLIFLVLFGFMSWGHPIITRTDIQSEAMIDYQLSFDIATKALKNRPVFGSGPSTYGYNFSLYRPKDLNGTGQYDIRFFSDRGMLLESISTLGIVGAIVLVVILLTYVSTIFHAFMRTKDDEIKIIALGLFITSALAMVYAMFWSVDGMIILYGALVGSLLIGILRSGTDEKLDHKVTLSISSSPQHALSFAFVSILVAVGVIFGFVTLGKMFVADVHAGNALRARAAGNFEKSSVLFQKAVLLNDKEGRYYTVISQYGLDLANVESAKPEGERNDENIRTYIKGATGTASVGRELMPNDVLANETKGFIFENSGGYAEDALNTAMDAYRKASQLEPQNPYLDIAIGKLKLVEAESKGEAVEEKKALINEAQGFFESAREKTSFDRNGKMVSVFAPAHYYISVVEEALGNKDLAIESMMMALQVTSLEGNGNQQQITSRQINYGFNLARLLQSRGTEEDIVLAERLLLEIIGVNDQEVNSHLSLGLLYERTDRKDQAVQEYKKIIAILPESDGKARENIQQLIDTVEQGGSNIDAEKQDSETTSKSDENKDVSANETPVEKPSVLIVKAQAGENAQGVQDVLGQAGYSVEIRDEEGRVDTGVVIMYKGAIDREAVKSIEESVKKRYTTATSERNDQEVAKYNHDIVIVVGKDASNDVIVEP